MMKSEGNGHGERTALVAGAASGIGAAVARRLHAEGARLFCADLDLAGARATAAPLEGATALALDVRLEESWRAAFDAVLSAAGPPHVFVNSVGISAASPLADTTLEEWRRVLSVNLDGAFLGTKHALRAMAAGGAIVHVGSASGLRPAAGAAAYATSKAGLRMLVRAAAKECREAGRNVRVNLVSPAGVKTPMWRAMPFFQELVRTTGSEDAAYAALSASGGGPFAEPDEIARVICFLASDAAAHVTGADLPADDGFVL